MDYRVVALKDTNTEKEPPCCALSHKVAGSKKYEALVWVYKLSEAWRMCIFKPTCLTLPSAHVFVCVCQTVS